MKKNITTEETIQRHINAAKSEEVGFTHEKLRSIVEHTPSDFSGTSTNSSRKKIITMSILGITLAGALTSALLWLQPQQHQMQISVENTTTRNQQPRLAEVISPTKTIEHAPVQSSASSATSISRTQTLATVQAKAHESITEPTATGIIAEQDAVPQNIQGITPVTLSVAEASFLGIRVNDKCDISLEDAKLTTIFLRRNPEGVGSGEDNSDWGGGVIFKENNSTHKPSFSPWIVTTATGVTKMTVLNDKNISRIENDTAVYTFKVKNDALSDKQLQARNREGETSMMTIKEYASMSKFIAIRVESGCPGFALMFWYEPSMEFIRQLPARYHASLLEEVYQNNGHGTIDIIAIRPQTKTEEPKPGCRYLDVCRATAGAILQSSVFPNPASSTVSLRFSLNEPRQCSFSFHYLNGILSKQLSAANYTAGEHTFTMPVEGIEPGMYLLSMVTEKNERIVQRVVISK